MYKNKEEINTKPLRDTIIILGYFRYDKNKEEKGLVFKNIILLIQELEKHMPKFEANRAHYLLKWFQSIKDFHHKLNNNLKSLIKVKKY